MIMGRRARHWEERKGMGGSWLCFQLIEHFLERYIRVFFFFLQNFKKKKSIFQRNLTAFAIICICLLPPKISHVPSPFVHNIYDRWGHRGYAAHQDHHSMVMGFKTTRLVHFQASERLLIRSGVASRKINQRISNPQTAIATSLLDQRVASNGCDVSLQGTWDFRSSSKY